MSDLCSSLGQQWDREDSGMDKNDRGRPITIGEARIAAENAMDPYDKMIMQFLLRRVDRLMYEYEGEWGDPYG